MAGSHPRLIGGIAIALAMVGAIAGSGSTAQAGTQGVAVCPPEEGDLSVTQLPATLDIDECWGVVGRTVTYDDAGVTVPERETTVSVHTLNTDGTAGGFSLEVAADGKVTYKLEEENLDPADGADRVDTLANPTTTAPDLTHEPDGEPEAEESGSEVAATEAASSPTACSDGAYATDDLKEYGSYEWYVGDGAMPGGLSQTNAKWAFMDAVNNITESYNDCGYTDQVSAASNYRATTTYEADINTNTVCTARDGLSTWDGGNLGTGVVAAACRWSWSMPGVKNDLREADVRFNTTDYRFTDNPTSACTNQYDIRSVATHEAGHVFGLGHVGSGHENLTMYTHSFLCSKKARTLGKGDVLALRSVY